MNGRQVAPEERIIARSATRLGGIERVIVFAGRGIAIERRRTTTGEVIGRLVLFADFAPPLLEAIDLARTDFGWRRDVATVYAGKGTFLAISVRAFTDGKRVLHLQRQGEDGEERGAPMLVDSPEFDPLENALLELVMTEGR